MANTPRDGFQSMPAEQMMGVGAGDQTGEVKQAEELAAGVSMAMEFGTTGLKRSAGWIDEEFLPQLRGRKSVQVFKEMNENDPMVGALMFTIQMLLRNVEWTVKPGGKGKQDRLAAELLETSMDDMEHTWDEFISEVLTMLVYGWSWHEVVYKRRQGVFNPDPRGRSKYNDGLIAWRKMPIRAQETLFKWVFDDNGDVKALVQIAPPNYTQRLIPYERSLLFRFQQSKGNPEGRALDPATPVPTPDGWTTMGQLRVGSRVFDETGAIRHVVATAEWENRPRYRVTFADNTTIIADANHEWVMRDGRVKRTEDLTAQPAYNAISRSAPLQYAPQALLVDPYVLGVWLGDGDSNGARITTHVDDLVEQMELVQSRGYDVTKVGQNGNDGGLGRYYRIGSGLQGDLRRLGVVGNKHVPSQYLMGSVQQRWDVLAGLLDSDGHIDDFGRVEFTNTNLNLIESVAELVRSLGMDARVSVRRNAGFESGKTRNKAWAVRFTPTDPSLFGLSRKRAKVRAVKTRGDHYVRSVERIDNGSTVCIEVDAPSHLFLAGDSMVPSHNSLLRNAYRPWYMKKRIEEFEAVGVERDLAGLPMVKVPAEWLRAKAGSDQRKAVEGFKKMVKSIRRDEQEGLVFPVQYDQDTKQPLFDFQLLGSGGTRAFQTDSIIQRYEQRMLMTVLADFIMVGHESVGSYSLHTDKTGIFRTALNAIADAIAQVLNRRAVPRLIRLNGFKVTDMPEFVPQDVDAPDISQLSAFMSQMAGMGVQWFPDADLEKFVRQVARLPERDEASQEVEQVISARAQARRFMESQMQMDQVQQQIESMQAAASRGEHLLPQPQQPGQAGGPAQPGAAQPGQQQLPAGQ